MDERTSHAQTEEATPQRVAEARRRGSVAVSRDLLSGLTGLVLCVAMVVGGRAWIGGFVAYLRVTLAHAASGPSLRSAGHSALQMAADGLLWPLAAAVVAALAVGLIQTRSLFSAHPLRFELRRAMPSARRLLGTAALREVGKDVFKAGVVLGLAWWTLAPSLSDVARLLGRPAGSALVLFGVLGAKLGLRLAAAAVVLGAVDYLWQRLRHARSLRMSREEVERERKEWEGDPLHKAERQRLHREILEQQMIDEIRQAKLVVVDSGLVAVALGYDPDRADAPVIVAKGERLMAGLIGDVARAAGVPLWIDAGLARALCKADPGDEIPASAFEAVARLLVRPSETV